MHIMVHVALSAAKPLRFVLTPPREHTADCRFKPVCRRDNDVAIAKYYRRN